MAGVRIVPPIGDAANPEYRGATCRHEVSAERGIPEFRPVISHHLIGVDGFEATSCAAPWDYQIASRVR